MTKRAHSIPGLQSGDLLVMTPECQQYMGLPAHIWPVGVSVRFRHIHDDEWVAIEAHEDEEPRWRVGGIPLAMALDMRRAYVERAGQP